jgi:hypothetical protein
MTIVVLEHFTSAPGGGRDGAGLEAEGRAMRDAVAEDLGRLRGVAVVVVPRPEASAAGRGGRRVRRRPARPASPASPRDSIFRDLLRRAEAALVIAPESGGVLARLARLVGDEGRILLGPSPAIVRLAGDKLATARLLAAAGLPTPATEAVPFASAAARLRRRRRPFVLKPRDGCGCRGVVLVRPGDDAGAAIATVKKATARHDLLVQEWVRGVDASVSLVAGKDGVLVLGLNRQHLRRRDGLEYEGGETPMRHPLAAEAIDAARRAAEALSAAAGGLRGYLGIDLVLADDGPTVIEINPRLTTSYLGLRRVAVANLGRIILDAALGRPLPARLMLRGRCRFSGDGRVAPRRAGRGRDERSWGLISAGTSAASI